MDHLAIPVSDQERSRRFYDGVLMLYDRRGFALALGPASEPVARPAWMHFGVALADGDAVRALRDRLLADGADLVEHSDEPGYVSLKCRDPDGYIVEAFWEPSGRARSRA